MNPFNQQGRFKITMEWKTLQANSVAQLCDILRSDYKCAGWKAVSHKRVYTSKWPFIVHECRIERYTLIDNNPGDVLEIIHN